MEKTINFERMIKTELNRQHVSYDTLSRDLCDKKAISRMLSGKYIPSKLYRDRLLSRLNLSINSFTQYLTPAEYDSFLIREQIQSAMVQGDFTTAISRINLYKQSTKNLSALDLQFCSIILAQISLAKKDYISALTEATNAKSYSISSFNYKKINNYALADIEIFILLLIEYCNLKILNYNSNARADSKNTNYINNIETILKYMSNISEISKQLLEIFCLAITYYCNILLESDLHYKNITFAISLIDDAIIKSKKNSRFYQLDTLLMYKHKFNDIIANKQSPRETDIVINIQRLKKIFSYNSLDYVYFNEGTCLNVIDVINSRQEMHKLSNDDLCENICDLKTLINAKKNKSNMQPEIIRELLYKLGISAFPINFDIVTDDYNNAITVHEISKNINKKNYQTAYDLISLLESNIDTNENANNLYLKYIKSTLFLKEKTNEKIDNSDLKIFQNMLYCNPLKHGIYLTPTEMDYLILLTTNSDDQEVSSSSTKLLESFYFTYLNKIQKNSSLSIYLGYYLSNMYNDYNNFEKSNKIVIDNIKTLIQSQTLTYLAIDLFTFLCNCQNSQSATNIDENASTIFKICLTISSLQDNNFMYKFFNDKLNS